MALDPDTEVPASNPDNLKIVALHNPPPLQRRGTLALRHATGLLLFQGSNRIAKGLVKPIVNAASRLFSRPQSVKSYIDAFFGDDEKREKCLDDLHGNLLNGRLRELQRYCHKLMEFAHSQSSTVATQRVTFRIVIAVTTRYPGVRHLFNRHQDLKEASETDPPFHLLWSRPHQACDDEWSFYRDFAIFCISENNLTHLVEAEPPSKLSRIRFTGNDTRVPVETLLGHSSDGPEFHFPRLCAILYLAGILELPSFWKHLPAHAIATKAIAPEQERQIFFDVLRKLCSTVLRLIDDTGVSKADTSVSSSSAMGFARHAVDLLAFSTLNGVHRLHREVSLQPCPQELPTLVQRIVNAVLRYDSFVRASTLASAVKDILVSSSSSALADDATSPGDNRSKSASGASLLRQRCTFLSRSRLLYLNLRMGMHVAVQNARRTALFCSGILGQRVETGLPDRRAVKVQPQPAIGDYSRRGIATPTREGWEREKQQERLREDAERGRTRERSQERVRLEMEQERIREELERERLEEWKRKEWEREDEERQKQRLRGDAERKRRRERSRERVRQEIEQDRIREELEQAEIRRKEEMVRRKEAELLSQQEETERRLREENERDADLRRQEGRLQQEKEEEEKAARRREEADNQNKEKERQRAEAEKRRLEAEQRFADQQREAEIKRLAPLESGSQVGIQSQRRRKSGWRPLPRA
ncbi:hypothetical protein DFH06DRAFT_1305162 [Mycena polygramma]|nr:hypothetical protein DFH06DRAFT_1305162 [Mycena polygramma]